MGSDPEGVEERSLIGDVHQHSGKDSSRGGMGVDTVLQRLQRIPEKLREKNRIC